MRPLDLQEFAEDMRRKGDNRHADLADEILALIDIEQDVAEPYGTLCDDLEHYAPDGLKDKPEKALEWLGDRSDLLAEIEKQLDKDGRTGDTDDQVKAMVETLAMIRKTIGAPDTSTDEDLETAIQALAERPEPREYDL